MTRLLLPVLTLLLSAAAIAQPDPNAVGMANNPPAPEAIGRVLPKLNLDTPEKSARYFFEAVSVQQDYNASVAVLGAPIGIYGSKEWNDILNSIYPWTSIREQDIDAVNVDNQTPTEATVTITAHSGGTPPVGQIAERGETVKYTLPLHLETNVKIAGWGQQDKIWRVVPLTLEQMTAQPINQLPPFQAIATLYLRDPQILPSLRCQVATDGLKQLGLGALQFTQDYDGVYAFDDAAHERALLPYIRNASLFIIPGTENEKWRFNGNLSGKELAALPEPARTVLFYDGDATSTDSLHFRFDNKTVIGFADGHVKAYPKDELKDILWTP